MDKTAQKIIWQPHIGPQTFVLTCIDDEILYGGARGGGKTDAGLAWLLRWIGEPRYRFLVIRRNSKDLDDWIDRAKAMWAGTGAEFVQGEVRFPSGALGRFGHLHDEDAFEKYQGHEYQKMLIEELTHIPNEELYLKLKASCRTTVPGLKAQIFCTTNPGGDGHDWVRDRFVSVSDPMVSYRYQQKTRDGVRNLSRVFVPARLYDNPTLMKADPSYEANLLALPENLRKAWLEGLWDDFEVDGAYYTKEILEAEKDERIGDFPMLPFMPVHTWWDLGVGDATAIWFGQVIGDTIRFVDYFESSGESLRFYAEELARREYAPGKRYNYGTFYFPHDIQVRELGTGQTRLELAQELGMNPAEVVANMHVDDGINSVRMSFNNWSFDKEKCKAGINHLKRYRKERDEVRNVWKAKPRHDDHSHAADAIRYAAISLSPQIGTRILSTFYKQAPEEQEVYSSTPVRNVDAFDGFSPV